MKAPFFCENCGQEFTIRPAFSGSVGAAYYVDCKRCNMTTKFTIIELNGEADIYQELKTMQTGIK